MMALVLLVFIVFFPVNAKANQFKLGILGGYGTYALTDLKVFQNETLDNISTLLPDLKMVDQFPDYYNIGVRGEIRHKRHSFGVDYTNLFTGARISLADYSGSYNLDFLVSNRRLTGFYQFWFLTSPKPFYLETFAYTKFGRSFTNLTTIERLEVNNIENFEESYRYFARSRVFELGIGGAFRIFRLIELNLSIGYDFDFPENFKSAGDKINYQMRARLESIKPDWSGIRIRTGINILLNI